MKTFIITSALLLLAPVVAHADTVYGEHTWSGTTHTSDNKILRMAPGAHKVVTKADTAIVCGIIVPETRSILSVSHAAAGQECVTTWKQTESGTVVHFVTFDVDRAVEDDYMHPTTYTATFKTK